MSEVVICEPVRTPVGGFRGVLSGLSAVELATSALTSLLGRTGLGEGDVDDVVLGNCYPSGESPAIGRIAALDAGLGTSVPGIQIDRRCGSGLQAVLYAAMQVGSGAATLVIAGGTESMSQAEHYALGLREGVRGDGVLLMDRLARARITAGGKLHPVPGGRLETAENLRADFLRLVDDDSAAYARVAEAMKLPKASDDEKRERKERLQSALLAASRVPLEIAKTGRRLLDACERGVATASSATVSDIGVAAIMGDAAIRGAALNVIINLASVQDAAQVKVLSDDLDRAVDGAEDQRKRITEFVESRIAR